MFKLVTEPRYWWPVAIRRPDPAKPGEIVEHTFEAEFKWLSSENYQAWLDEAQKNNEPDSVCVPKVCTGFRKVLLEDGKPMESTPENLALLLSQREVANAFAAAFIGSRAKAAQKN
jgi:hypothetical protein